MPVESRRAFTLIEVMLVLAIIVIIAGLSWTAMQGPLAHSKLLRAADDVRKEWVEARDHAVTTGHTYAFRYMVHGDRYRLGPEDDSSLPESSADGAVTINAGSSPGSSQREIRREVRLARNLRRPGRTKCRTMPCRRRLNKTLPKGVRFLSENAAADLSGMGDKPSESAGAEGSWSDPIYFWADGTTSDARVSIAADRHTSMRLQLRGVTGSVTVDDVTSTP